MKKNYRIKKTISIKQFVSEFGENFSDHMKKRLLELEVRTVLTRKDDIYRLDLKHVEHTKHECLNKDGEDPCQKEYVFGQFVVIEGVLYFSEKCLEGPQVVESPIVKTIYNSLNSDIICDEDINSKMVDDSNIDYIIDTILSSCPEVSQSYLDIISRY